MKTHKPKTYKLGNPNIEHYPFKTCIEKIKEQFPLSVPRIIRHPKMLDLDETMCNVLNTNKIPFNSECYMRRVELYRKNQYIAGITNKQYEQLTADYMSADKK